MKKLLLGSLLVLVALWASLYFGEEHQRFLEFDKQREAWHRRCDAYIDQPLVTQAAKDCAGIARIDHLR